MYRETIDLGLQYKNRFFYITKQLNHFFNTYGNVFQNQIRSRDFPTSIAKSKDMCHVFAVLGTAHLLCYKCLFHNTTNDADRNLLKLNFWSLSEC